MERQATDGTDAHGMRACGNGFDKLIRVGRSSVAHALFFVGVLLGNLSFLGATPPTMHPRPHPFDPDWPDVHLILAQKCAGCHRPNSQRADLSSYEALSVPFKKEGPAVVPFKPEASPLWKNVVWNVTAQSDSDLPDQPEMPIDKHEWLTAGQLEILYRWIKNGALEYKLPDQCKNRPLHEIDFPSSRQCKLCHPRQYREWSRSMHAYAQHSPIFEAFTLTLQERTSGTTGTFCTRCHTPIGVGLGETGSTRNSNRSRLSMEGVTCVTCHRRNTAHYKNSGRIHIEPGKLLETCIYGPFDTEASAAVGGHVSKQFPYIKRAQFCGDCHDVTSPTGARLEEAFSEWQNSPAAANGIQCQACHMGPVQGLPFADHERPLGRAAEVPGVDPKWLPVRNLVDHTFAGPDYSLLPDTEFPHKLDWMYEVDYRNPKNLTAYQQKTLAELRRSNREHLEIAQQKRLELLRNALRISVNHPNQAGPGEKMDLRVDVHSVTAGHFVPTGFTVQRQVWVSVLVRDPFGSVVFSTGDLDANMDLRNDHSFAVRSGLVPLDPHLFNFQGKNTIQVLKGSERSVVVSVNRDLNPLALIRPATTLTATFNRSTGTGFRVARESLPPLRTLGNSYPISLPNLPGVYLVEVKVNYRNLEPTLFDLTGVPHLKHLLQIVTMAEYRSTFVVGPMGNEVPWGNGVPMAKQPSVDAYRPVLPR